MLLPASPWDSRDSHGIAPPALPLRLASGRQDDARRRRPPPPCRRLLCRLRWSSRGLRRMRA